MLNKLLELSSSQSPVDGWVSYKCPFCTGRSRPILNIQVGVGTLTAHCWSTSCEAHGHKRYYTNINEDDLVFELKKISDVDSIVSSSIPFRMPNLIPIPDVYRSYLSKYHIGKELIYKYRIGYDPLTERMIIPCSDGYLSRSETEQPKWKNFTCKPFITGVTGNVLYVADKSKLFIVEDPLSAIRLGEYTNCVALLGTNLQGIHLDLCVDYDKVYVWLDPDRAGYVGMYKIKNKLSPYCDVTIFRMPLEAKELTNYQLKEVVC